MRNILLGLGFVSLGFLACSPNKVESNQSISYEELSLIHLRDIMLPLDNETSGINNVYRIVRRDGSDKFLLFNSLNYSLYTYDLATQKIESKIPFEKEGPNGLGSRVMAFELLADTAVLFHSYYRTELIITDLLGTVTKRIQLKDENSDFWPQTTNRTGIGLIGNSAYLYSGNTQTFTLDNPQLILNYNLKDSSVLDSKIRMSHFYESGDNEYLPRNLFDPALSLNQKEDLVITAFPLDDSVSIINKNGDVSSRYFGSKRHQPKPPIQREDASPGQQGMIKDYMKYSKYGNLQYDSYRNIYVRTFMEAAKESDLEVNKFRTKQRLLLADKDFNPLGEALYSGSEQLLFIEEGMLQVMLGFSREDSLQIKVWDYGL